MEPRRPHIRFKCQPFCRSANGEDLLKITVNVTSPFQTAAYIKVYTLSTCLAIYKSVQQHMAFPRNDRY